MRHRKGPVTAPAVKEDPKPAPVTPPSMPLDGVVLPPYSGETARCVKCNSTGARTTYMAEKVICDHWGSGFGGRFTYGQERMHRECRTCGWVWDERCYQPEENDHDG